MREVPSPPKTKSELLSLPFVELLPNPNGFHLAVIKIGGAVMGAQDDNGDWWVPELTDHGYVRRSYPCCPWV
jgi:hypothetical protein